MVATKSLKHITQDGQLPGTGKGSLPTQGAKHSTRKGPEVGKSLARFRSWELEYRGQREEKREIWSEMQAPAHREELITAYRF